MAVRKGDKPAALPLVREGGLAHKPKTSQERKAERRREKLEEIRQQIAAGTLTVRQMTPAERKRHPPPARPAVAGDAGHLERPTAAALSAAEVPATACRARRQFGYRHPAPRGRDRTG